MKTGSFFKATIGVITTYSLMEFLIEQAVFRRVYTELNGGEELGITRKFLAVAFSALLLAPVFVHIFHLGYRRKGLREGIRYGFFMGLLLSLVTGLNLYAILRVPIGIVWQWTAYGMVQYMLCGLVLAAIFQYLKIESPCMPGQIATN